MDSCCEHYLTFSKSLLHIILCLLSKKNYIEILKKPKSFFDRGKGELENAEGHENETVQCGGPANEAGHYAPPPPLPIGFLCCVSHSQYECKIFRLLVYTYGVIENATFVHLRLNSLPGMTSILLRCVCCLFS